MFYKNGMPMTSTNRVWHTAPPTLFVFMIAATCTVLRHNLTPSHAPTQHPCMQPHFTPTSSLHTLLHLIAISILATNCLSGTCRRALSLQLVRTELPFTSTQTTSLTPANTRPPHPLAKYKKEDKRALVVPPGSPQQRALGCGACTGTAQVGVSLVSLFNPHFKRSRLHCLVVPFT